MITNNAIKIGIWRFIPISLLFWFQPSKTKMLWVLPETVQAFKSSQGQTEASRTRLQNYFQYRVHRKKNSSATGPVVTKTVVGQETETWKTISGNWRS